MLVGKKSGSFFGFCFPQAGWIILSPYRFFVFIIIAAGLFGFSLYTFCTG